MTPVFAKLSISPESSDGFASVGTILPKEEATLLPGGLFSFLVRFGSNECPERSKSRQLVCSESALGIICLFCKLVEHGEELWRLPDEEPHVSKEGDHACGYAFWIGGTDHRTTRQMWTDELAG